VGAGLDVVAVVARGVVGVVAQAQRVVDRRRLVVLVSLSLVAPAGAGLLTHPPTITERAAHRKAA
jgi:hypothetical protein